MPAWIYVVALAAVAFVAWFGFARRWWHGLRYNWTRARHLAIMTETEEIPGAEFLGSMSLADDPAGPLMAQYREQFGDVFTGDDFPGPRDSGDDRNWRRRITVELAPETLDLLAAPADPGPGGDARLSTTPPPGPDQCPCGKPMDHTEFCYDFGPEPTRLADAGDVEAAHVAHPSPDWLEAQRAEVYAWVRGMVPQVTGWSVGL